MRETPCRSSGVPHRIDQPAARLRLGHAEGEGARVARAARVLVGGKALHDLEAAHGTLLALARHAQIREPAAPDAPTLGGLGLDGAKPGPGQVLQVLVLPTLVIAMHKRKVLGPKLKWFVRGHESLSGIAGRMHLQACHPRATTPICPQYLSEDLLGILPILCDAAIELHRGRGLAHRHAADLHLLRARLRVRHKLEVLQRLEDPPGPVLGGLAAR